jgi:hypothetical protein
MRIDVARVEQLRLWRHQRHPGLSQGVGQTPRAQRDRLRRRRPDTHAASRGLAPDDRGLLYGDGVFRTFLHGPAGCWDREAQFERLADDCRALGLPPSYSAAASTQRIAEAVAAVPAGRRVVRVTVTRGSGGARLPAAGGGAPGGPRVGRCGPRTAALGRRLPAAPVRPAPRPAAAPGWRQAPQPSGERAGEGRVGRPRHRRRGPARQRGLRDRDGVGQPLLAVGLSSARRPSTTPGSPAANAHASSRRCRLAVPAPASDISTSRR